MTATHHVSLTLCVFASWREIKISHAKPQSRLEDQTGRTEMTENEIARMVVDAAYQIHVRLGPGLLESVYESILAYELRNRSLKVVRQVPIPVIYDELQFEEGFRADLMVQDSVIIEFKSVEIIQPVHKKQLLTYLRLTDLRLGLLINFGEALIRDGISRIANGLKED